MERKIVGGEGLTYPNLDGISGYSVYVRGHKPKLSEAEEKVLLDIMLLLWDYDRLKKRINNDSRM